MSKLINHEHAGGSQAVNIGYVTHPLDDAVAGMIDALEKDVMQLESKLKEAAEFIQKLGPTIDYEIVAEIEEMLGE